MTLIGVQNPVWLAIKAVVPAVTFASLYESFQALTSIQVSHFVEWFSGDAIDSIWFEQIVVGSGHTFTMVDEIDGGAKILLSSTAAGDHASLNFNNKRHYDPADSTMIAVGKRVTTGNTNFSVGFHNVIASGANRHLYINSALDTFTKLHTQGGAGGTTTNTDIAVNTNFENIKIVNLSSSVELFINGVLKVTNTTTLSSTKMQPDITSIQSAGGGAASDVRVRYVEFFNTSVSILSSLYERLSALTQIMGQRVVETFSGALLNERWNFFNILGSGSGEMTDEIDGGFKITTSGGGLDISIIDFNGKRQYDETASEIIAVTKRTDAECSMYVGCGTTGTDPRTTNSNTARATARDISGANKQLITCDGTTTTSTNSSIAGDTAFTGYKIILGGSDIKLFINGVLEITKTTNRPNVRQQPLFSVGNSTAAPRVGQIRYLEMYNKLTIETEFSSVYELFNSLTTLAKQHFWEWFDGQVLSNRWNEQSITGSGHTFTIEDEIDGGYKILLGSTAVSDAAAINFANIRHYDPAGSILIGIVQTLSANAGLTFGFKNLGGTNRHEYLNIGNLTFTFLLTNGGSTTATDTDIAVNTNVENIKIENLASSVELTVNGVLKVTNTTNLSSLKMQPSLNVTQEVIGAPAGDVRIRYVEAFNK